MLCIILHASSCFSDVCHTQPSMPTSGLISTFLGPVGISSSDLVCTWFLPSARFIEAASENQQRRGDTAQSAVPSPVPVFALTTGQTHLCVALGPTGKWPETKKRAHPRPGPRCTKDRSQAWQSHRVLYFAPLQLCCSGFPRAAGHSWGALSLLACCILAPHFGSSVLLALLRHPPFGSLGRRAVNSSYETQWNRRGLWVVWDIQQAQKTQSVSLDFCNLGLSFLT